MNRVTLKGTMAKWPKQPDTPKTYTHNTTQQQQLGILIYKTDEKESPQEA